MQTVDECFRQCIESLSLPDAKAYIESNDVKKTLADAITTVMRERPENPVAEIGKILTAASVPAPDPVAEFKGTAGGLAKSALQMHLVQLGDELGMFQAFLDNGAMTVPTLASKVGVVPRYLKEWCMCMATMNILEYTASSDTFGIVEGIKPAIADPGTMALFGPTVAGYMEHDKLIAGIKSGKGVEWGEHHHLLYSGTKRFFGPVYEGALIPNLPKSIKEVLEGGGLLADIGCGQGVSVKVLAGAFPRSKVTGYDLHEPSINAAKELTKGLGNVTYEIAGADTCGASEKFDVVIFLDCFHDMAVAGAAAKNAARILKPGGQVMLIEMMGPEEDTMEAQLALPSTEMFSTFSCHFCLPCGLCNGGDALGTTVATSVHRKLFLAGGFKTLESVPNPLNEMGFRVLIGQK